AFGPTSPSRVGLKPNHFSAAGAPIHGDGLDGCWFQETYSREMSGTRFNFLQESLAERFHGPNAGITRNLAPFIFGRGPNGTSSRPPNASASSKLHGQLPAKATASATAFPARH